MSQSVIVISYTGPKFHPDMIETVFLAAKEGRLDDLKVLLDHLTTAGGVETVIRKGS